MFELVPDALDLTWRDKAACREEDPWFFTEAVNVPQAAPALAVCRRCPVRSECADEATTGKYSGVWGGHLLLRGVPIWITPRPRGGRPPQPRVHGSGRGYNQHRYHQDAFCDLCTQAHSDYANARNKARRAKRAVASGSVSEGEKSA